MKRYTVRELIPPLIALVLLMAVVALFFELLMASFRGQPVDPGGTTVLGTVIGVCVPTLAGLYLKDSKPPPSDPPPPTLYKRGFEETGDEESDEWNRDRGYLEFAGGVRCLP